jgi:glycine/D-amino acid oxidase-like deaminating enzyme
VTRTRYGVSPWIDEFPKSRQPDYPRYRDESEYPVVIVGGGLAGVFSAYAFAAAGVKVALLEAERLGHAGAARGPGVLQGEAAPSYRDVEARHGRKAARALFESSRRAVLDVAATARRLGITDVETGPALRVLSSWTADEKPLLKDTQLRREAGLDITWLKSAAIGRETRLDVTRAGARVRDWGHADPYRLLVAVAKAAAERGAELFERSAVKRVKVASKHVDVLADGGSIRAQTVVVCTGEPTDLYRSLKRHVRRDERYVVMTERLPASVRKQIVTNVRLLADTETPPHLVRFRDDGRLIIAGADQTRPPARGRDKIVRQRTGQLMYELSRLFPAVSGAIPVYGWDMPVAVTQDEVMVAGPHRNYPRHLFAWATRHDPAQAFLASRILLRNFLGQPERDDRFFSFTRG